MKKVTKDDADLLLRLYELRREPELRLARIWYSTHYVPKPWPQMKEGFAGGSDEDRFVRMVTSYWDMVAALVNLGTLNEELFFQTNGEDLFVWDKAKMWVPGRRADMKAPYYLTNLESLVRRHAAYRAAWKGAGTSAPARAGKRK